MTKPVGTHGLTCIDEADYGAIALWVQCTAESIDDQLTIDQGDLNAFRNRQWFSMANTSSISVNNASGFVLPEGKVGEVTPSTYISGSWSYSFNNIPDFTDPSSVLPAGVFMMGSSIRWTVATPNNNTIRNLEVFTTTRTGPIPSIETNFDILFQQTDWEASTGGGSLNTVGFFRSDGVTTYRAYAAFYHENTSSDLVVPVGGWRFWWVYMGSGLVE